jgi:hypothetical protein
VDTILSGPLLPPLNLPITELIFPSNMALKQEELVLILEDRISLTVKAYKNG